MAKAKKSTAKQETTATPVPAEAPQAAEAPRKAPRKAPARKAAVQPESKAAPARPAPAAPPLIDTSLVAKNAAQMLVGKVQLGVDSGQTTGSGQETSTFKHLKEQIAKPRPASLSHLLGSGAQDKKSGVHSILGQQRGHNQTQGHFNKTGVPRRTNG